ncbi:bifunctional 3-(3-hydroxy-phenyl)propionate/3-hydroxycinnamic acid hydroxylase [Streptomyces seoulensis]|uniref:3-(3-hydroxyphenyl)propionate hydroxylase n=1 Tax=Streptomyces seoulensis TaxID=73044 RepID=A0A5P2GIL5_STRSO|nr:3-(3-hydroxyphenyl)propionate hydroxylase [Streptomyces seoulensis]QKW31329.1 bifunctional 3-(3-hydroxy-phenyl)propionate/3-hydroxycinnamic acid hydroxylase [Streptomyces seoulensis]
MAPDGRTGADRFDSDVVIVGYGPVGQVLAILLARQGWRVTVVERWENPYRLPRATSFDGETARTLVSLGLDPSFAGTAEPVDAYDWRNAAGATLLRLDFSAVGAHGYPDALHFQQPRLEDALRARAATFENLRVHRGRTAVDITDDGDGVALVTESADGERSRLTSAWLVGCDGANSFVRRAMGAGRIDLDFSHDWLLCDVVLDEPRDFVPVNTQICDPSRPTTVVGGGPGRRRWEFMRLPDEKPGDLDRPETAWRLLEPFDVTPDNAVLTRHTVYTFKAELADTWRTGRLLLAGDAAHSMPPFAGAGMCSGIRDALNLSWKLDLVLKGVCEERLLDSYGLERGDHVRRTTELSVQLGKIICITDEAEAERRDAALLAGRMPDRSVALALRDGLLRRTVGTVAAPPTGSVAPQGRVGRGAVSGLFDQVVGTGFVLLATADPAAALGPERRRFLAGLDTRLVHLVPDASGARGAEEAWADLDDVYLPFLASAKAQFALVRPDRHVFGVARNSRELGSMVDQLRSQLTLSEVRDPSRR